MMDRSGRPVAKRPAGSPDGGPPTPTTVCATCKRPIEAGSPHYRCSVSACNAGRIKLRFCSVECWRAHIPTARHRKASWVEEPGAARSASAPPA